MLNHYRFKSTWLVEAPSSAVFEVLQNLAGYATWWPEVRSVEVVDAQTAKVVIRAFLPYALEITMHQKTVDPAAGILRADMSGDLQGWSQWRLASGEKNEWELTFEEDVEVLKPLLRALAPVARPLFRLNHAIMMARGETGLRKFLANGAK